jgi:hypothetical protein
VVRLRWPRFSAQACISASVLHLFRPNAASVFLKPCGLEVAQASVFVCFANDRAHRPRAGPRLAIKANRFEMTGRAYPGPGAREQWFVKAPELFALTRVIGEFPCASDRLSERGHLHQCCDQPQQCLLFGSIPTAQKLAQFNMGEPTTRGGIGLVNDESATVCRLAPKKP